MFFLKRVKTAKVSTQDMSVSSYIFSIINPYVIGNVIGTSWLKPKHTDLVAVCYKELCLPVRAVKASE